MSQLSPAIANLEPAALWQHFAELSRIPRESKHEKAAGDFVVRIAKDLGLPFVRDSVGSVVEIGRAHV